MMLTSLVSGDYAIDDLRRAWPGIVDKLRNRLPAADDPMPDAGYLEIYGIAGYVPVSIASFCCEYDGKVVRYCTLEPGISVQPRERPILVFKETCGASLENIGSVNSEDYIGDDIYNKLRQL